MTEDISDWALAQSAALVVSLLWHWQQYLSLKRKDEEAEKIKESQDIKDERCHAIFEKALTTVKDQGKVLSEIAKEMTEWRRRSETKEMIQSRLKDGDQA